MKKFLIAAVLVIASGPGHAYDASNTAIASPLPLPPTLDVAPKGTSTLGGPTMADAPARLTAKPKSRPSMRRR